MSGTKSWKGCWTCRLRHKKCDETYPECKSCSTLLITCYYGTEKPAWMDNGPLQRTMVERFKQEIKEKSGMRRTLGYMREAEAAAKESRVQHEEKRVADTGPENQHNVLHDGHNFATVDADPFQRSETGGDQSNSAAPSSATRTIRQHRESKVWPGCDPGFMSYYLDFFFPFLFPFYQPHMLQGGRTWLLDFINEAEGVQQSVLALSSYLFSIVLDATEEGHEKCKIIGWDKLLAEMQNAFKTLRAELPGLGREISNSTSQQSRAVRILGTIVHLQRFEIATHGFANSKMHLEAAIRCFKQILDTANAPPAEDAASRFYTVMARMGPSPWPKPYRQFQIPSSDQVGFRFFVSLLVADDIISSTSLAEEPRLHKDHTSLLSSDPEFGLPVDLETVIGCQNLIMLQIGEISALAAWKRRNLSHSDFGAQVMERGTIIQDTLENHLEVIQASQNIRPETGLSNYEDRVLSLFRVGQCQRSAVDHQSKTVAQIWAHGALIYLLVTLHGWHPSRPDIAHHVHIILELLASKLSEPALLRSVVWPFCIAGCLAELHQESIFRHHALSLQPAELFVTVRKALEIMEAVWLKKGSVGQEDVPYNDIADCLRATGEVLFLV